MTNDALKAAITKALEDITIKWKEGRSEAISFILAELQPLIDADQKRIEQLEKALLAFQLWDQLTYKNTLVEITEEQINAAYQKAVSLMRAALREVE